MNIPAVLRAVRFSYAGSRLRAGGQLLALSPCAWHAAASRRANGYTLASPFTATGPICGQRYFSNAKADLLVNDQICFPKLRVVDERGFLGDFDLEKALMIARERNTDLVLVDPQVVPPLARLVHAETYAEKQHEKEMKRFEAETPHDDGYSFDPALKIKGMRFLATIDPADFDRKMKIVIGFLEKGHRVEVDMRAGKKAPTYRGSLQYRMPRFIPPSQMSRSRMHPVALLAKRILAESADVAKLGPYMRGHKGGIMRLWPCTPQQAARSRLPSDAELEKLYGGYAQDPTLDEDFFQYKKRDKGRDIEEHGVRRPGVRKEPRKNHDTGVDDD